MITCVYVGCLQAVEDPNDAEAANQQVVVLNSRSKTFAMRLYTQNTLQACTRACMHTHCITLHPHNCITLAHSVTQIFIVFRTM